MSALLPPCRGDATTQRGLLTVGVANCIWSLFATDQSDTPMHSAIPRDEPARKKAVDAERAAHKNLLAHILPPIEQAKNPARSDPWSCGDAAAQWALLQFEQTTNAHLKAPGSHQWVSNNAQHPAALDLVPHNHSVETFSVYWRTTLWGVVPSSTPEENWLGLPKEECLKRSELMWENIANSMGTSGDQTGQPAQPLGANPLAKPKATAPTPIPPRVGVLPLVHVRVPPTVVRETEENATSRDEHNSVEFRGRLVAKVKQCFAGKFQLAILATSRPLCCVVISWGDGHGASHWDYTIVEGFSPGTDRLIDGHLRGWWDGCVADWYALPERASEEDAKATTLGEYTTAMGNQ